MTSPTASVVNLGNVQQEILTRFVNELDEKLMKKIPVLLCLMICSIPAVARGIVFNDFSDVSSLVLNGSTTTTTTGDGVVLRVTPAAANRSGSAFSSVTTDAADFSTRFQFRITDPGGRIFDCNTEVGADGLVFVVQSISSSIGGLGQGIGYSGIGSSVGVEFDTWCNAGNNDPDSNHVGIDLQGIVNHGAGAPFTAGVSPNFDDGNLWTAWIDYDGATLEVRANQTGIRPATALVSRSVDIPTELGGVTEAFVGFTSGTGADWGNHDILNWRYTGFVPEPAGLQLMTVCLLLVLPRLRVR